MEKKMSLKLLVDNKSQKVLFAETGKDFVNFLLNLLQQPLGHVTRLLDKRSMAGCLGTLYQSVQNLEDTYFQSAKHKKVILNPTSSCVFDGNSTPLLLQTDSTRRYYSCGSSSCGYYSGQKKYITDVSGLTCPQCKGQMATEMIYIANEEKRGCDAVEGYVKGVVTYMVMDDLAIAPMSIISSITLLNKFDIKEIGFLEERMVEVGMEEGLTILKQSLQSKTVLTDVFLGKEAAGREGEKGAPTATAIARHSMSEDTDQAIAAPAFGQPASTPASSNFVFGSAVPLGGPSVSQLGMHPNPATPQNPSPFSATGNFVLGTGGSFSLHSREIVRVRRDRLRRN